MKKYRVYVSVSGWVEVEVEANSATEAEEMVDGSICEAVENNDIHYTDMFVCNSDEI